MKIKLFVSLSVLYIVLLGAFAFHINSDNFTLNLGSKEFTAPVMVWVVAPVVIMFVFALVHMSFYGLLRYLKYKHFFDDGAKFEKFVCALLLEKPLRADFRTKEFKDASELTQSVKTHKKIAKFEKLNEIIDLLSTLKEGKSANLRKFKLDENNPLFLQNEKNRIANEPNYAISRIKGKKEIDDELDILAFESVLEKGDLTQIKSLKIAPNTAQRMSLLMRFEKGTLDMSATDFEWVLKGENFEEKDYLKAVKIALKRLEPDALIGIFKRLKNTHIEALRAYLFILADLSMFDELRLEIGNDKKHFNDFKIVLLAREKNISIDLNHFIQ